MEKGHSGFKFPIESNGDRTAQNIRIPIWFVIAMIGGAGVFGGIGGGIGSTANDPTADITILQNQVNKLEASADQAGNRLLMLRDDLNKLIVEFRVYAKTGPTP